jgi:hypothetical protein
MTNAIKVLLQITNVSLQPVPTLCTTALILFIHVGFLEYLSFKQFKLIVKMTRIESGVTVSKGLFINHSRLFQIRTIYENLTF